jgi:hypothetical protein
MSGVKATREQLQRVEDALWAQVVVEFPEVKTGDMDAMEVVRLSAAIEHGVNCWLLDNHPGNHERDPETDPLPEPCTSANGLECTHPGHDHRAAEGDQNSPEMLCNHCGRPTFWDEWTKRYWHTDVAAPACFLVAARS